MVVHLMDKFRIYRPMHYCVDSCLFCVHLRDKTETLRIVLGFLSALLFKDGANGPFLALLKALVDGFASKVFQTTGAMLGGRGRRVLKTHGSN